MTRFLFIVVLASVFGSARTEAAAGDVQASDVRALRRLLPYQNLFYIRALVDKVEEGAIEAMGVAR